MKKRNSFGQYLAEFFGIFFFLVIGLSTVAVLVTGMSDLSFSWLAASWGMAVSLAIFITAGISGAHLNPAVTISLAIFGGFDKRKVLPYIFAQMLGAFTAAALVYALFRSQFAGAAPIFFATGLGRGVSMPLAFLVETVLTFMLMMVIYAVTDSNNPAAPRFGLGVVCIGAIIAIGGISLGPLTGFAMNPARDLGPRLFAMLAGGGTGALGPNAYGLIVPIFGTILGAILAGILYKGVLARYYPSPVIERHDEVWEVNESSKESNK